MILALSTLDVPHLLGAEQAVHMQMGSFFVEQGSVMDRRMGDGWKIPAASLSLFNTLSIIVLIPLYDRGLVPLLRRMGIKISLLSRIGAPGLAFAPIV